MIKLKDILIEQGDVSKKDTKLKVLFIGDVQSTFPWNYAKRLLRSRTVTGKLIAKSSFTTSKMFSELKSNLTDEYDIVSIMGAGIDEALSNANIVISTLRDMYTYAKSFGAKLIVITNPTKQYLKSGDKFYKKNGYPISDDIANWINSQTIADDVIDVYNFKQSAFSKNNIILNSDAHRIILNNWSSTANNFDIPDKLPVIDKEAEKSKDSKTDSSTDSSISIGDEQRGTAKTIMNYLKSKGLSEAGAAAVTGNLYVESAGTFSTTIKGDNGSSIGLAQWHNERWTGKNGLVNWSKSNGKDPYSIEGQLDFLLWELSKSSYSELLNTLKTTNDPGDAAELFCKIYERPAVNQETYNKRRRYAEKFFSENIKQSSKLTNLISKNLKITSPYGARKGHKHLGVDYKALKGTKIVVLKPGKILRAGNWNPTGWGNCIEIKHEDGIVTRYAHLSKINVTANDQIDANTIIGETGGRPGDPGAGSTTGEHLHWEYLDSNVAKDGALYADEYFALV